MIKALLESLRKCQVENGHQNPTLLELLKSTHSLISRMQR
jgi:hypothetical protein